MAALRPSPERVPEDHAYFPKRRASFDMAVIVRPASNDRVEQPYQVLLFHGSIRTNRFAHFLQKGMHSLSGGRNQELAAILAQVLPKEVEAIFDMRDAGFLGWELQAPVEHKTFDQRLDLTLQKLLRASGDDESSA